MEKKTGDALNIFVMAGGGEAGRVIVRNLVQRGHHVTSSTQGKIGADRARADGALPVYTDPTRSGDLRSMFLMSKPHVVVNLVPQTPNTMFHDGHKWKGFEQSIRQTSHALLQASQATGVPYIIHTSYAFMYGDTEAPADENAPVENPGDFSAVDAAIESEKMFLDSAIPASVLRAGFLYGPESEDLALWQASFRISRPYIKGTGKPLSWVSVDDFARAIALTAEQQPEDHIFNIVDDTPAAFATFMHTYIEKLGFGDNIGRTPSLIERWIATPEHLMLLELPTHVSNRKAREVLGWKPQYTSFREGLDQMLLVERSLG